jgi:uncharacterized protein YecE (DUF72 family)
MRLTIGTAGYAYDAWVGGFYPRGISDDDKLRFYSEQFPAVEINNTFYRPLTAEQIERMARRVPAGFGFTLKVPRSVSHDRSPDDLATFVRAADRLRTLDKLLGLLLQVPEQFRNTAENRDWLAGVGKQLKPHRVAVEFRHRSWNAPNLSAWMEHIGMDVVSVGVPDVPSLFPRGLRVANRRVYARLHSQNAENWYEEGKLRYDYDYPDETLREWAVGLQRVADEDAADSGLFFFNNCVGVQATRNARRFAELLKAVGPSVKVVAPPPPRQPDLFGDA